MKLAELLPARTVTLEGTVAALLALVRETTVFAAAGKMSATVPDAVTPPRTGDGVTVTELSPCDGTWTVSVLLVARAFAVTVNSTFVLAFTANVVIVNVPVVLPAGIVIVAGADATARLALVMVTTILPGAAGA